MQCFREILCVYSTNLLDKIGFAEILVDFIIKSYEYCGLKIGD